MIALFFLALSQWDMSLENVSLYVKKYLIIYKKSQKPL